MQRTLFISFIFISTNIYSQQDVKVKAKGNGNQIETVQERKDTSTQKISIDIEGDTNKTKVNQKSNSQQTLDSVDTEKKDEPSGFKKIIENTNLLITLLISIPTLILAWRGMLLLKKKKNKK